MSLPSATVYPPGSCRTIAFQRHRFRLLPSNSSLGDCGVVSLNQSTLRSRLTALAEVAYTPIFGAVIPVRLVVAP